MTPKEKADELIINFFRIQDDVINHEITWHEAKQCALVAVDEILKSEPRCPSDVDWDDVGATHQYYYEAQREQAEKYWQEVKKELQNKLHI